MRRLAIWFLAFGLPSLATIPHAERVVILESVEKVPDDPGLDQPSEREAVLPRMVQSESVPES